VAKTLYLSSQNTIDYYKSFCSISKFLITNTTFFLSWNIFIIPLISITYRALIHNYNTIKCIYFISPCQHVGMSSSLKKSKSIWYLIFNIEKKKKILLKLKLNLKYVVSPLCFTWCSNSFFYIEIEVKFEICCEPFVFYLMQ
jgi:hypothetical protein